MKLKLDAAVDAPTPLPLLLEQHESTRGPFNGGGGGECNDSNSSINNVVRACSSTGAT